MELEFKGTKNWKIRYFDPEDSQSDFFIQADKLNESDAYDVEVMGDDYGDEIYPTEFRLADAKLIVAAPKLLKSSIDAYIKLQQLANSLGALAIASEDERLTLRDSIAKALDLDPQEVQEYVERKAIEI